MIAILMIYISVVPDWSAALGRPRGRPIDVGPLSGTRRWFGGAIAVASIYLFRITNALRADMTAKTSIRCRRGRAVGKDLRGNDKVKTIKIRRYVSPQCRQVCGTIGSTFCRRFPNELAQRREDRRRVHEIETSARGERREGVCIEPHEVSHD